MSSREEDLRYLRHLLLPATNDEAVAVAGTWREHALTVLNRIIASERPKHLEVDDLVQMIDEPNRRGCMALLQDNRRLFETVQGSTNNHQAWPGGYLDHVREVMNIAVLVHGTLLSARMLSFSLSDLLLVVFLHDVEKPWKYDLGEDGQLHHKPSMQTKEDHQRFRMEKLAEYGISLTPEQENGLKYAEGELMDYSSRERRMGPLAAAAHMCDVASARIWFDHPRPVNDEWAGASRCAKPKRKRYAVGVFNLSDDEKPSRVVIVEAETPEQAIRRAGPECGYSLAPTHEDYLEHCRDCGVHVSDPVEI